MILRKYLGANNTLSVLGCTTDYATNYNPNATRDNGTCVFPDKSTDALIVESSQERIDLHGIYVQQEFNIGYPSGTSVLRGKGITDGFQYAGNTELGALIYSYSGLSNYILQATNIYPTTQMFMPLGSNDPVLISDPPTIPVIITCGAGSTHNITGYGPGLEFFDTEVSGNPAIQSSLSNGRVAGKILNIRNTLSCTFWEARFRARITATRTLLTHPDGEYWNQNNGFGIVDVSAAIAYAGSIPADPYINNTNTYIPFVP